MRVQPHEGYFRFLVQSESTPDLDYLVDLEEYDGNGCCGCTHFSVRLEGHLREGARGAELQCKHIEQARAWLGEQLVKALLTHISKTSKHRS